MKSLKTILKRIFKNFTASLIISKHINAEADVPDTDEAWRNAFRRRGYDDGMVELALDEAHSAKCRISAAYVHGPMAFQLA